LALTIGVGVAAYAIVAQNPPVAEPIDAYPTVFSAIRAMKHVEAIAREPHPTGSEAIGKVRDEIVEALKKIGLEPEIQTSKDSSKPWVNVVVRMKGKGQRIERPSCSALITTSMILVVLFLGVILPLLAPIVGSKRSD
jgi:hypothetical protein